jgi:hypothetical protein
MSSWKLASVFEREECASVLLKFGALTTILPKRGEENAYVLEKRVLIL